MTALQIDKTPNSDFLDLATKLFLTWICSLLWGAGIFLSIVAIMNAIVAGLLNYFDPPAWNAQSTSLLILGFLVTIFSPIFLGALFTESWWSGFTSGLFASFIATVGFFLSFGLVGFLFEIFYVDIEVHYSFLAAFPAALAIITILLRNQIPHSRPGIVLGFIIGLGITLVDSLLLGQKLLVNNNVFHLLWQVPPLIWVSIIYYSESAVTGNRRAGFLIWSLLILITFGLPFLIVPLFSLQ